MQLSLSFSIVAASWFYTSRSYEFLGYQLPRKSSAAVLCSPQLLLGILFLLEDGDQCASLIHALWTNSCSVSRRAAVRSQPASSCRQCVPPRVPSVSQLEPVVTLRWELVLLGWGTSAEWNTIWLWMITEDTWYREENEIRKYSEWKIRRDKSRQNAIVEKSWGQLGVV